MAHTYTEGPRQELGELIAILRKPPWNMSDQGPKSFLGILIRAYQACDPQASRLAEQLDAVDQALGWKQSGCGRVLAIRQLWNHANKTGFPGLVYGDLESNENL